MKQLFGFYNRVITFFPTIFLHVLKAKKRKITFYKAPVSRVFSISIYVGRQIAVMHLRWATKPLFHPIIAMESGRVCKNQ